MVGERTPVFYQYLQHLLRRETLYQIEEIKDEWFKNTRFIPCHVSGNLLTREICEADHDPITFAQICFDFFKIIKLKPRELSIEQVKLIIEKFKIYHKNKAILKPCFSVVNKSKNKLRIDWGKLL